MQTDKTDLKTLISYNQLQKNPSLLFWSQLYIQLHAGYLINCPIQHFQLHAGYLIKCPILNSPYSSSNCELCSVISISVVDTITQTPKPKHWDQLRFLHSVLFPIKFLRSFQFHLSLLSVRSFSLATTATTSDSFPDRLNSQIGQTPTLALKWNPMTLLPRPLWGFILFVG